MKFIGNRPVEDDFITWEFANPERGPTLQDLAGILSHLGYEMGVNRTDRMGNVVAVIVGKPLKVDNDEKSWSEKHGTI